MPVICFIFLFLFPLHIYGSSPFLEQKLKCLEPLSIAEHLAFYELYPEEECGKQALAQAWKLLSSHSITTHVSSIALPSIDISHIISLLTHRSLGQKTALLPIQLRAIQALSSHFPNQKLKGYSAWSQQELLLLNAKEIDLARALLIEQFGEDKDKIVQYEAALDLMALQVQAKIPKDASDPEIIGHLNHFIFHEMQFHFPAHSLYAKDIDLYTFLPSVMDSREGVCLGVSVLYLCIAQRLGLDLEIITPPGHIYLRYRGKEDYINIETTARGVNYPSEIYLGIDTKKLQQRSIKDVIGLTYVNQASVAWGQNDFAKAVSLYQKARLYLPNDPLLNFLEGLNTLFIGKIKEGKALLSSLQNYTFEWSISSETICDDFFAHEVDIEGLKALFLQVDETKASIIKKQNALEAILQNYPRFRAGILQKAVCFMQLGSLKKAQSALEDYHRLDPCHPVVEYYLASILTQRMQFQKAWHHYQIAQHLLEEKNHSCPALISLKNELKRFLVPLFVGQ